MDLDYLDLFETFLSTVASGGKDQILTASVRDAGQEDGQVGRDCEVWQEGCIVYRPAKPTDAGRCQALATRIGDARVIFATRDTRAAAAVGDLSEGDAAFCSPTGKVALICKDEGSIALLKQASEGADSDSVMAFEKDGAFIVRTPWGQIQFDADGFAIILTDGPSLSLTKEKGFTVTGPAANLATSTVALGVGASVPLTFAPTTGVAKPAPSVFV